MRQTAYQIDLITDDGQKVLEEIAGWAFANGFEQKFEGMLCRIFFRGEMGIATLMDQTANPPFLRLTFYWRRVDEQVCADFRTTIDKWLQGRFPNCLQKLRSGE